jgi:hypothetical protein
MRLINVLDIDIAAIYTDPESEDALIDDKFWFNFKASGYSKYLIDVTLNLKEYSKLRGDKWFIEIVDLVKIYPNADQSQDVIIWLVYIQ